MSLQLPFAMAETVAERPPFIEQLQKKWAEGKFVCVGLDPDWSKLPPHLHEIRPQFDPRNPIWFHHHGIKMMLKEVDAASGHLAITGSAAWVDIDQIPEKRDRWNVVWKVKHSYSEQVMGLTVMRNQTLARAFGLDDETDRLSLWLITRYGGTSAEQGQYIRYRDYLNINCPGTGHDGDPNVSIFLDEEIKQAIRQILGR